MPAGATGSAFRSLEFLPIDSAGRDRHRARTRRLGGGRALVLPIIHDPLWAMAYLLVFGVGTIAGMMLITAAIAVPVSYSTRFRFLHRHLGTAAGFLSLGFGLFLVYQIGFVDGLFTR